MAANDTPDLNWLERGLAAVAPGWAANRMRARVQLGQLAAAAAVARKYEAAAAGRRTDGWTAAGTSANAEVGSSLEALRNKHRQLVRDNAYAKRAVNGIANNVVGAGIIAAPDTTKARTKRAYADAWKAWADTTLCDADGRHNLYGLQLLAMRTVAESGGALIRRRIRRAEDGLPVPLQIQVLEPDYIDLARNGPSPNGGNQMVQGVEFDAIGRLRGYWLFAQHPGDAGGLVTYRGNESRFVPASEVVYLYRPDRSGQVHGVPWGAPVMLTLHDLDEYQDAQLMRQKIAACFSVIISGSGSDNVLKGTRDSTTGDTLRRIEPGMIMRQPDGVDVSFPTPPTVQGYDEHTTRVLHQIAAGYEVPFSLLTGDLRQVNFSSGRMGWLEFQRCIDVWRWSLLIPHFCDVVWGWFAQVAFVAGVVPEVVGATWTPPRREMIDPTKEVPALRDAVRAGFMSPQSAIRSLGEEPEQVLADFTEWNTALDAAGVVLDSDPRRMSAAGQRQQEAAGAPANGNADGNTDDNA